MVLEWRFGHFPVPAGRAGKVFLHPRRPCSYPIDIYTYIRCEKWPLALESVAEILYKKDVIPNQHRDPF
jgi:hypothetical protein